MSEWTTGRVLDFIRKYIRKNGYAPSLAEIGEACGLSSLATVTYQLNKLEKQGRITRKPGIPRSLVVVKGKGGGGGLVQSR